LSSSSKIVKESSQFPSSHHLPIPPQFQHGSFPVPSFDSTRDELATFAPIHIREIIFHLIEVFLLLDGKQEQTTKKGDSNAILLVLVAA
jgi:hypothetical protein